MNFQIEASNARGSHDKNTSISNPFFVISKNLWGFYIVIEIFFYAWMRDWAV